MGRNARGQSVGDVEDWIVLGPLVEQSSRYSSDRQQQHAGRGR
jgi:hypothetical protein